MTYHTRKQSNSAATGNKTIQHYTLRAHCPGLHPGFIPVHLRVRRARHVKHEVTKFCSSSPRTHESALQRSMPFMEDSQTNGGLTEHTHPVQSPRRDSMRWQMQRSHRACLASLGCIRTASPNSQYGQRPHALRACLNPAECDTRLARLEWDVPTSGGPVEFYQLDMTNAPWKKTEKCKTNAVEVRSHPL